jgi:hypothetical protein
MESMRAHLHHEIDYRREAALTARMGELARGVDVHGVTYHVPELRPDFCTDSVLAMEFIQGFLVTDEEITLLSQERRNALAMGILELFFYELYDWGVLQTDPNFGNYLVRLEDNIEPGGHDELVLLDFGSVLDCTEEFLFYLRRTIAAGLEKDVKGLAEGLVGLGCLPLDASEEARRMFGDFCLRLLEPLQRPDQLPREYLNPEGEYCWGKSRLMRRAGKQAALSTTSRHFTPPSRDFALIARKLTGVFNFISVLDAEFNAYDMVEVHINRWREREGLGARQ